jgi:hypothetical protein
MKSTVERSAISRSLPSWSATMTEDGSTEKATPAPPDMDENSRPRKERSWWLAWRLMREEEAEGMALEERGRCTAGERKVTAESLGAIAGVLPVHISRTGAPDMWVGVQGKGSKGGGHGAALPTRGRRLPMRCRARRGRHSSYTSAACSWASSEHDGKINLWCRFHRGELWVPGRSSRDDGHNACLSQPSPIHLKNDL